MISDGNTYVYIYIVCCFFASLWFSIVYIRTYMLYYTRAIYSHSLKSCGEAMLRAPRRFSQRDGNMARPGTISGFRMARPL